MGHVHPVSIVLVEYDRFHVCRRLQALLAYRKGVLVAVITYVD